MFQVSTEYDITIGRVDGSEETRTVHNFITSGVRAGYTMTRVYFGSGTLTPDASTAALSNPVGHTSILTPGVLPTVSTPPSLAQIPITRWYSSGTFTTTSSFVFSEMGLATNTGDLGTYSAVDPAILMNIGDTITVLIKVQVTLKNFTAMMNSGLWPSEVLANLVFTFISSKNTGSYLVPLIYSSYTPFETNVTLSNGSLTIKTASTVISSSALPSFLFIKGAYVSAQTETSIPVSAEFVFENTYATTSYVDLPNTVLYPALINSFTLQGEDISGNRTTIPAPPGNVVNLRGAPISNVTLTMDYLWYYYDSAYNTICAVYSIIPSSKYTSAALIDAQNNETFTDGFFTQTFASYSAAPASGYTGNNYFYMLPLHPKSKAPPQLRMYRDASVEPRRITFSAATDLSAYTNLIFTGQFEMFGNMEGLRILAETTLIQGTITYL